jgi:hypothetical protein
MIPRETIRKILEESVQAPSGENAQPWRFGIRGNEIHVMNIPERDRSPYNFRQRASFVANGTVIENISIVASAHGHDSEIALFPDGSNPDLVAVISLVPEKSEGKPKDGSLYPYIVRRTTNRKPYARTPLAPREKKELLDLDGDVPGTGVFLTDRKEDIVALAHVGSMNERVAFENKFLHDFLFDHINWTDEENEAKKIGFDIKTLELPPPARAGFSIFKHWGPVSVFNKIGLSKAIWKQNGTQYASAAAIAIIAVDGNADEDFVRAGRMTQRFWLTATRLGLSLQPMTGILYFMQRILADTPEPFSARHVELIKESYEKICGAFNVRGKTIPMMFRIGHSDPPTAQSLKLPPEMIDLAS